MNEYLLSSRQISTTDLIMSRRREWINSEREREREYELVKPDGFLFYFLPAGQPAAEELSPLSLSVPHLLTPGPLSLGLSLSLIPSLSPDHLPSYLFFYCGSLLIYAVHSYTNSHARITIEEGKLSLTLNNHLNKTNAGRLEPKLALSKNYVLFN